MAVTPASGVRMSCAARSKFDHRPRFLLRLAIVLLRLSTVYLADIMEPINRLSGDWLLQCTNYQVCAGYRLILEIHDSQRASGLPAACPWFEGARQSRSLPPRGTFGDSTAFPFHTRG